MRSINEFISNISCFQLFFGRVKCIEWVNFGLFDKVHKGEIIHRWNFLILPVSHSWICWLFHKIQARPRSFHRRLFALGGRGCWIVPKRTSRQAVDATPILAGEPDLKISPEPAKREWPRSLSGSGPTTHENNSGMVNNAIGQHHTLDWICLVSSWS